MDAKVHQEGNTSIHIFSDFLTVFENVVNGNPPLFQNAIQLFRDLTLSSVKSHPLLLSTAQVIPIR